MGQSEQDSHDDEADLEEQQPPVRTGDQGMPGTEDLNAEHRPGDGDHHQRGESAPGEASIAAQPIHRFEPAPIEGQDDQTSHPHRCRSRMHDVGSSAQPRMGRHPAVPHCREAEEDGEPSPGPSPGRTGDAEHQTSGEQHDGGDLDPDPGAHIGPEHEKPPQGTPSRCHGGAAKQRGAATAWWRQSPGPGQADDEYGAHQHEHGQQGAQLDPTVIDRTWWHERGLLTDCEGQGAADDVTVLREHPPGQHVRAQLVGGRRVHPKPSPAAGPLEFQGRAVGQQQRIPAHQRDVLTELQDERGRCRLQQSTSRRVRRDQRGMRLRGSRSSKRQEQRSQQAGDPAHPVLSLCRGSARGRHRTGATRPRRVPRWTR